MARTRHARPPRDELRAELERWKSAYATANRDAAHTRVMLAERDAQLIRARAALRDAMTVLSSLGEVPTPLDPDGNEDTFFNELHAKPDDFEPWDAKWQRWRRALGEVSGG